MKSTILRLQLAQLVGAVLCAGAQVSPDAFPTAEPETQGVCPVALESIASTIKGYSDRHIIVGGTFLVIKNRHSIRCEAYGWQDRENQIRMQPDTLFNIRSMTKMLTGAACQVLIDAGIVKLDDPVADYLPGFNAPRSRDITVQQLLTHRSGLPLTILTSLNEYPTLYAMANAIGERGPQFTPGSRFWYSDAGADCLGAMVEVASGKMLDAFVRTRLLEPLGMRDTYYLHEAAIPRSRIGALYMGSAGAWTNIWTPDRDFYPFAWGSQGLFSTPNDYARFLAMLLDKGMAHGQRILSEAAVSRILTPISVMSQLGSTAPFPSGFPDTQCFYGQMSVIYGSAAGAQVFGHSGSDGTWAWAWPDQDLIILYFTQSRGQATGIRLETEFDHWLWHPERQTTAAIVERFAPYLGWYQADFQCALGTYRNEEFAVVLHNDHLGLDIPGHYIFELRDALPSGRWYFQAETQLSVSFDHDAAGVVTGLRFYEPNHLFYLPRIVKNPAGPCRFGGSTWLASLPDASDGSAFRVQFQGIPYYRYLIECCGDLVNWIPLQTNVLVGSRLEIVDQRSLGMDRRFYRARVADF